MKNKGFSIKHLIFFLIIILSYTFYGLWKHDIIYIWMIIPFGFLVLIIDNYIFENEKTKSTQRSNSKHATG